MKLAVFSASGTQLREIDAADEVFDIEPHQSVLHQAYVAQMANRRAGNANTKRRGEVAGSTAKIRKQKGLGRSRQGSIRGSHHVGGGIAMGPKPHDFDKAMPRTMKRLALRSALSAHARAGSLRVVEGLVPDAPRTRALVDTLGALDVQRTSLLVSGEHELNLQVAARNIQTAKAVAAANLNVVDLLNAHTVLVTEDAIRKIESLWGGANVKPARGRNRTEEAVSA